MPQKLHHAATLRIALPRLHHPAAEGLIVLPRPLQHPLPAHRKLRAARRADLFRDLMAAPVIPHRLSSVRREDARGRVAEDGLPHLGRDVPVEAVRGQAAGVPVAAEVDVAVGLDEGEAQCVQGGDVGVQGRVGVPGGEEAGGVGVQERERGGERAVVVDEVGQVGHAFVAFVQGRGQGVGR